MTKLSVNLIAIVLVVVVIHAIVRIMNGVIGVLLKKREACY